MVSAFDSTFLADAFSDSLNRKLLRQHRRPCNRTLRRRHMLPSTPRTTPRMHKPLKRRLPKPPLLQRLLPVRLLLRPLPIPSLVLLSLTRNLSTSSRIKLRL